MPPKTEGNGQGETALSSFFGDLPPTPWQWQATGVPYHLGYGDIYFQAEDPLGEATHVYAQGVGLGEGDNNFDYSQSPFCLAELGFGAGVNFVASLAAWFTNHKGPKPPPALIYIGIEEAPLPQEAFAQIHQNFLPTLAQARLSATWWHDLPPRMAGWHRLRLCDGLVELILIYAEAGEALQGLGDRTIDAWYLDGFAPSRNPLLWRKQVIDAIARCSKPGARLASFSVAGIVRESLQKAGFTVWKREGFGRKRQALSARFPQLSDHISHLGLDKTAGTQKVKPWFAPSLSTKSYVSTHLKPASDLAIIGGGIAGRLLADEWQRLYQDSSLVLIYAKDQPCASRLPAGVMYALPPRGDDFYSHWLRFIATEGGRFWQNWADAKSLPQILDLLPMRVGDAMICVPHFSGTKIIDNLALTTPILTREVVQLLYEEKEGAWQIFDKEGQLITNAKKVVLAAGGGIIKLLESLGFRQHGLVTQTGTIHLVEDQPHWPSHGLIEKSGEGRGYVSARSSHQRLMAFDHLRGFDEYGMDSLPNPSPSTLWQGTRLTSLDHLPVVGPVPCETTWVTDYEEIRFGRPWQKFPAPTNLPHLYVLGALGARGFLQAPLLVSQLIAIIASEEGRPIPTPWPWPYYSQHIAEGFHPARFLIRNLQRS